MCEAPLEGKPLITVIHIYMCDAPLEGKPLTTDPVGYDVSAGGYYAMRITQDLHLAQTSYLFLRGYVA